MYEELKNKTILVTGATGLIGQATVRRLLSYEAKVIALVRNEEKARRLFGRNRNVSYIISDITELEEQSIDADYFIHAASNTSSAAFVQDPVGTSFVSTEGTRRVLEIAKSSRIKSFVYLSSMEVYGTPKTEDKIDELSCTNLNTMSVRSAYPESKRMCENLCAAYASQYAVPVRVIRLAQTLGPGVQYNDGRVFAELARCVIEGKDIVLHTKGETKRSYLYTEDAVDAILTVLLKGKTGEAYNAANEDTYCSIYEMAEMVARKFGNGMVNVLVQEDNCERGYAPQLYMNLDTMKLRSLGWNARTSIEVMYKNMIEQMKRESATELRSIP